MLVGVVGAVGIVDEPCRVAGVAHPARRHAVACRTELTTAARATHHRMRPAR